jgi:hypothetical protein
LLQQFRRIMLRKSRQIELLAGLIPQYSNGLLAVPAAAIQLCHGALLLQQKRSTAQA